MSYCTQDIIRRARELREDCGYVGHGLAAYLLDVVVADLADRVPAGHSGNIRKSRRPLVQVDQQIERDVRPGKALPRSSSELDPRKSLE